MITRYNREAQLKEGEGILFDQRSRSIQKKFEALETVIYHDNHYDTALETEERQPSILRSLDFFNSIGPDLRILNVCRGKTNYDSTYGMHCACGLSYPDKLWWNGKGTRKFRCRVVWDEFV